jgi:hypothetical protein
MPIVPMIYRRTDNVRTIQLLLGQSEVGKTMRYRNIDIEDAFVIADQIEIQTPEAACR